MRTIASALLLTACSSQLPADLGQEPLDRVSLVDAPPLAHLAAALDRPGDMTVEELLRAQPEFARAPDPSIAWEDQRAAHLALEPLDASVPLRVLSYNVGLLDRWYPFSVVRVPKVDARRAVAPARLLGDQWDVLMLQEVWEWSDVRAFEREAQRQGYLSYAGSSRAHEGHGLLILVRKSLVDPNGPDERREMIFELQRDAEASPGPGIERGYLRWRFRHAPTGREIDLFDTHTTAFAEFLGVRSAQAREIGLAARRVPEDELVVVAGDVNAAPYYPADVYGEAQGEPVGDWWRNAQAYPLLLHYGGLQDAHVLAGQARDVEVMNELPTFAPSFFDEPFGDVSRCASQAGVFTVSDCNSLAFAQFAAEGYPARIDYILLRDATAGSRVMDSTIEYEAPLPGEDFELSDHHGVGTTLLLVEP